MSKAVRRNLLISMVIVFVAFVMLNTMAYKHAHNMMYFATEGAPTSKPEKLSIAEKFKVLFTGINLPRPKAPISLPDEYERVIITSPSNIRLGAWYASAGTDKPLVIMFHGYASEKSDLIPEAEVLRQMGLSVLLVDFRGSGESSESYSTIGWDEAEDVAVAIDFAKGNLPHSKIVLYGQSMGAAATLRAVAELEVKPDALIIEAVFDRLINTARNRFRIMKVPSFPSAELLIFWGGYQAGYNGFDHNPVEYAEKVSSPILFLHGSSDERASIEEARRVYEAVSGHKIFREFPETGHESCVDRFPTDWQNAVSKLLVGAGTM